jgi:hypothetical protein
MDATQNGPENEQKPAPGLTSEHAEILVKGELRNLAKMVQQGQNNECPLEPDCWAIDALAVGPADPFNNEALPHGPLAMAAREDIVETRSG